MKTKNPHAVALGRAGGKAGTGDSKRRKVSSEQARAAVNARWARWRAANRSVVAIEMVPPDPDSRKRVARDLRKMFRAQGSK